MHCLQAEAALLAQAQLAASSFPFPFPHPPFPAHHPLLPPTSGPMGHTPSLLSAFSQNIKPSKLW